jgi:hypothetical protein
MKRRIKERLSTEERMWRQTRDENERKNEEVKE